MGNMWHDIEPGERPPHIINVIVEIPKGSQNKYEYDKKRNIFKLDRVLFSPFHYPGDYGIMPQTLAEDGDALDALVLVTNPTHPGILIECRPIAMLRLMDVGKQDDKLLCVPKHDPRFGEARDMEDIPHQNLREIAHFFQVYKELEGKKVELVGWKGAEEAKRSIEKSIKLYKEEYKKSQ